MGVTTLTLIFIVFNVKVEHLSQNSLTFWLTEIKKTLTRPRKWSLPFPLFARLQASTNDLFSPNFFSWTVILMRTISCKNVNSSANVPLRAFSKSFSKLASKKCWLAFSQLILLITCRPKRFFCYATKEIIFGLKKNQKNLL